MGIEPRCRLVKDSDLRALHHNFGEPEPLPHAARKGANRFVRKFGEPNAGECGGDPLFALHCAKPDQPRGVT